MLVSADWPRLGVNEMSGVDWSKAPEWATRLMRSIDSTTPDCWVDNGLRALWVTDMPSMEFKLYPPRWILVEIHPDTIQTSQRQDNQKSASDLANTRIMEIAEIICRDGAFDIDDPEVTESAVALYDAGYRKP